MSSSRPFGFVAGVLTASCVIWSALSEAARLKPVTHNLAGITGRTLLTSTDGCGPCHTQTSLTLNFAGPIALYPGQSAVYGVQVQAGAPDALVGIDVASSDPGSLSLADGEPTQLVSGEITHTSSPKMLVDGAAYYLFRYTMPANAAVGSVHQLAATVAVQNVGWAFAPGRNIGMASVPTPTGLTASSVGATSASLTWTGTSPQFRVLRKNGANASFAGPTDAAATLVYEGGAAGASATGLMPTTDYTFAVYGKGGEAYSSGYAAVSITTLVAGGSGLHYYVATTGNDANPGTAASPFKTVTKGLSVALPADVVNVASGTYDVASGEVFPLVLPSGVWLLGASAPTTILDAWGSDRRVLECLGDSRTLVSGFTLRGGTDWSISPLPAIGGGIYSKSGDQTTITRNIITNNSVRGTMGSLPGPGRGGGMYIEGSPVVTNNLISSNSAQGGFGLGADGGAAEGGGLYITGTPTLVNNTIIRNIAHPGGDDVPSSLHGDGRGGGAFGGVHVNTIFAFNSILWSEFPAPRFAGGLEGGAASYCLFFSNSPYDGTTGTNAVLADPQFANADAADYHPLLSSPAKGAGTSVGAPTIDLDGRTRPSSPTIGAYEATLPITTTTLQSSTNPSMLDQNVTFTATVTSTTVGTISGSITFRDGGTTLGTVTIAGGSAAFSTAALTAGQHTITAEYGGSLSYAGSTSSSLIQTVNLPPFGTPANFSATANGTSQVLLAWRAVADAASYEVQRATSNGNFSTIASPASAGHTDNSVNANTTYLYRVRAIGSSISAYTPVDIATTVVFTDDPLTAGTPIKAVHITQLRTAVNSLRIAANLGGGSYTDNTLTPGASVVRAIHIAELRAALDEARAALGFATGGYTDATLTAGSTIAKAVHITDIRARVK